MMTTSPLQSLFETIHQSQDEAELRSQVIPKIGEYFTAKRWGLFFFDQLPLANPQLQEILQAGLSVDRNPVVRHLIERHAPVHEGLVTTPKVWRVICPRADHWHVMAGPIIDRGQLVGAVGCTRDRSMSAFDTQDLADLSAICLHLSLWNSQQHERQPEREILKHRITDREWQIAELVALGKTNAEIGKALWITENSVKQALKRMFRKLEVSSRAELVAQLIGKG